MQKKKIALLLTAVPLMASAVALGQAGMDEQEIGFGLTWGFVRGFLGGAAGVLVIFVLLGKFKSKQ